MDPSAPALAPCVKPAPTRWQRVRRRLWRGSVCLILPLLVAEGILQLVYQEESFGDGYWGLGAFVGDERFGYTHAPGFHGHAARRGQFRVPVAINAHGLRQQDFEAQMAQPRRILLLGASYVFGLGVLEEEGLAALLAAELNPAGIGVINAAQSGFGVEQSALFGRHWLEQVAPERVILATVPTHDAAVDFQGRWREREVVFGKRLPVDRCWPHPANDWLRTHSFVYMFLGGGARTLFGGGRQVSAGREFLAQAKAAPESILRPTLEALSGLDAACRARGCSLGVILIGAPGVDDDLDPLYASSLETDGIPVLHCAPPDFVQEDFLGRDAHWSAAGHRRAAERILSFLSTTE